MKNAGIKSFALNCYWARLTLKKDGPMEMFRHCFIYDVNVEQRLIECIIV